MSDPDGEPSTPTANQTRNLCREPLRIEWETPRVLRRGVCRKRAPDVAFYLGRQRPGGPPRISLAGSSSQAKAQRVQTTRHIEAERTCPDRGNPCRMAGLANYTEPSTS